MRSHERARGGWVFVAVSLAATVGCSGGGSSHGGAGTATPASTAALNASTAGDMRVPRSAHTATLVANDMIVIAGGVDAAGAPTRSIETFQNGRTPLWRSSAVQLATARVFHTATALPNGRILIAGGQSQLTGGIARTTEIYNPSTDTIVAGPNLSTPRAGASAVLVKGNNQDLVVISGGVTSGPNGTTVPAQSADIYDVANNTIAASAAVPAEARYRGEAIALDSGEAFFAGGAAAQGAQGSPTGAFAGGELFNGMVQAFEPKGRTIVSRTLGALSRVSAGEAIYFGGLNDQGQAEASAEVYDVASGTFQVVRANMLAARISAASASSAAGILVVGGFDGQIALASIDVFAVAQGQSALGGSFVAGPALGFARHSHTATALSNGDVIVIGGVDTTGAPVMTAERVGTGRPTVVRPPIPTNTGGGTATPGSTTGNTGNTGNTNTGNTNTGNTNTGNTGNTGGLGGLLGGLLGGGAGGTGGLGGLLGGLTGLLGGNGGTGTNPLSGLLGGLLGGGTGTAGGGTGLTGLLNTLLGAVTGGGTGGTAGGGSGISNVLTTILNQILGGGSGSGGSGNAFTNIISQVLPQLLNTFLGGGSSTGASGGIQGILRTILTAILNQIFPPNSNSTFGNIMNSVLNSLINAFLGGSGSGGTSTGNIFQTVLNGVLNGLTGGGSGSTSGGSGISGLLGNLVGGLLGGGSNSGGSSGGLGGLLGGLFGGGSGSSSSSNPAIATVNPTTAVSGGLLTITGSGFSSTRGNNTILVDGQSIGQPTQASGNSLTVRLPLLASGPHLIQVRVTTPGGLFSAGSSQNSNSTSFNVQ